MGTFGRDEIEVGDVFGGCRRGGGGDLTLRDGSLFHERKRTVSSRGPQNLLGDKRSLEVKHINSTEGSSRTKFEQIRGINKSR